VVHRDHLEETRNQLRNLVPPTFKEPCEVQVVTGDPADVIVHFAQERGADLIVMGSHGHTGLRHLLLGSVAEKVLRHAPCPVLIVRHTCTETRDRSNILLDLTALLFCSLRQDPLLMLV
jgi:nucleotide-binding universal stress UspA family protein